MTVPDERALIRTEGGKGYSASLTYFNSIGARARSA